VVALTAVSAYGPTFDPILFDPSRPVMSINVCKKPRGTVGRKGCNLQDILALSPQSYAMVKVNTSILLYPEI
jgi:hypothetical protein